jgi:hypothetical protein
MRPNKYTEREKEAKRLFRILYGRDGRGYSRTIQLAEPWWTGDYEIMWLPNWANKNVPEFDTVMSLIKYLPNPLIPRIKYVFKGKHLGHKIIDPKELTKDQILKYAETGKRITRTEYETLDPEQRKFFHVDKYFGKNELGVYGWYPFHDRKGEVLYKLELNYKRYFNPVLKKHKITKVYSYRREEPEVRKLEERLNVLRPYWMKRHHSVRSNRINVKTHRKEERELEEQIREGFEQIDDNVEVQ